MKRLEAIWSGDKSAQEAMDSAKKRGDKLFVALKQPINKKNTGELNHSRFYLVILDGKTGHFSWMVAPNLFGSPTIDNFSGLFLYPAAQAVWQSLFIPDPFGLSAQYVGLGNFEYLLSDKYYRASFVTTAVFSILVTLCSMVPALFLAVCADRLIKSSGIYRTLLIWPYAVAPAVAGVLWMFMFNTRVGIISWYLGQLGYDWNHVLNDGEAMGLVVVASAWGRISYNFLFFFAALQSVPKSVIEAGAIDGARFWRRFFDIVLPLITPTAFFPNGGQCGLFLL